MKVSFIQLKLKSSTYGDLIHQIDHQRPLASGRTTHAHDELAQVASALGRPHGV